VNDDIVRSVRRASIGVTANSRYAHGVEEATISTPMLKRGAR